MAIVVLQLAMRVQGQEAASVQDSMHPYLKFMEQAASHAAAHGDANKSALSPEDASVLDGSVPVAALHAPSTGERKSGVPAELLKNHTVSPHVFVDTLCGAIKRNHMESRADVQSFDFRTLVLVEEQFPAIPTYYLTEDSEILSTEFVPSRCHTARQINRFISLRCRQRTGL